MFIMRLGFARVIVLAICPGFLGSGAATAGGAGERRAWACASCSQSSAVYDPDWRRFAGRGFAAAAAGAVLTRLRFGGASEDITDVGKVDSVSGSEKSELASPLAVVEEREEVEDEGIECE